MARDWRLVDSGLRSAAQNIALDRALLEARRADEIPTTLRFFRTTVSALLGLRQCASHELEVAYCRAHDVPVQRRITAGSAYYTDPAQLGWSLYVRHRELADADLRAASRQLCHAVATALSALGADVHVRRHDEIEGEGRTIGGCTVASDGDAVLFHGWISIALDVDSFVQVLRMPAAHAPEYLRAAAAERFCDLRRLLRHTPDVKSIRANVVEALESAFDSELSEGDLTLSEESRFRCALPEVETAGWTDMFQRPVTEAPRVSAVHHGTHGVLRAALLVDLGESRVKRAWLDTDMSVNPRRTLLDLEAELRDVPFARIARRVEGFFASRPALDALRADDVVTLLARALGRPFVTRDS